MSNLRRNTIRVLLEVFLVCLLLLAGVFLYVYYGAYNVAASAGHAALTSWFLDTAAHRSVESRAKGIQTPPLENPELIASGLRTYQNMCAACHLAPDEPPTSLHRGLTPQPPELAAEGSHMTPAEDFWIIKHGIKMTGMPAWGESLEDDKIWELVAAIRQLPHLSVQEYRNHVQAEEAPRPMKQ